MTTATRILYVDDEPAYCRIFKSRLSEDSRFQVQTAQSGDQALSMLESYPADIVIADLNMPLMDGIELLKEIKRRTPSIFVLILTGDDTTALVVKAMKTGAYDYLLKPLDFDMIIRSLENIISHKQAILSGDCPDCLLGEQICFENLIGQDRKMFEIYEKISQVAQTSATVLIVGESGTGKELIASAIHNRSTRKDRPFIQVNCAALTESLISSELFGHEKGAFTGAISRKKGFFEQASGGTLFLDEIGDISLTTQVALLRILELGTFQRVGGTETIKADVRLICATNRDLVQATREKLFREDLYYRLNVVTLQAPPLRERRSDIPLLTNYFLTRFCKLNNRQPLQVTQDAMDILCKYPWPGNCRELANVLEHAVIFCTGAHLSPENLPNQLQQARSSVGIPCYSTAPASSTSLATMESNLILKVLQEADWNLKKAAESLDIARGTLYSKMEKYGISKPD